ncbi:MAG: EAL domain-containing protein [Cyanobacteria bacterium P01_G01_bin.19]
MDSLDKVHHVLVIEDPSFRREISLDAATYSIGRHSSNDIVLSCQKTSRNHATLLRRTDVKTSKCSYWVLDGDLQGNRSRNGIYINGKKTLVHELKDGDSIQFSGDAQAAYKISIGVPVSTPQESQIEEPVLSIDRSAIVNKETIVASSANLSANNSTNKNIANNSSKTALVDSARQISLTELSPQPIIEIDLYGNITYINSAGIINFKDIHHRKLSHPLLENLISSFHQGKDNIINREVVIGDKAFWQTAHYLPENKVVRNYIVDITQQKKLETEIKSKADIFGKVTQHISDGIILVESTTKQIIDANPACSDILGYSQADLLNMNVYEIACDTEKFSSVLQRIIVEKNLFSGECLLGHKNGDSVKTSIEIDLVNSESQEIICLVIKDFSSQNKSMLTNLPIIDSSSTDLFKQQIETSIANARRSENLIAVTLCKLYFLPDIRNNLGAHKSKELLATLGKRLNSCLRSGDTVIHWEDDKYALLMPQVNGIEEVAKINKRIQQSVEQSFQLGETKITLNGSLGVAIYPQDGRDTNILLANANTALERAYQSQQSYQFYNESINSQALVALELEASLQKALEKEEFELYYQPQIDWQTGKTEAIEALLRWHHPEFGLITPNNFIKSAEISQLIVPIGEWVIRQACAQNKAWQEEGLPASRITVSLSSVQFQQTNLVSKIAQILTETDLNPNLLELEISAISLLKNIEYTKSTLDQLNRLGVRVAVDDFAAGFSILEYLKHFPLSTLKIDKTLIQQLNNPQDLAIASALIKLGQGFDLRIVAEGVETQQQVELLRDLGCQQMQGFWFSRPLKSSEASKLLSLSDSDEKTIQQMAESLQEESRDSH